MVSIISRQLQKGSHGVSEVEGSLFVRVMVDVCCRLPGNDVRAKDLS